MVSIKTNQYLTKHDRFVNIFDINRNSKVQQKLAGPLALNVISLAQAKKLFDLKLVPDIKNVSFSLPEDPMLTK